MIKLRPKKITGSNVITKWRTVRDNFVRCQKENVLQSSTGTKRRKRYIYAKQLGFLKRGIRINQLKNIAPLDANVIKTKIKCEDVRNRSDIATTDINEDTNSSTSSTSLKLYPQLNKKIKSSNLKETLMEFMERTKQEIQSLNDDEDFAFFKSLLPSVRNLNADQKIQFRIQVLQTLHDVKRI